MAAGPAGADGARRHEVEKGQIQSQADQSEIRSASKRNHATVSDAGGQDRVKIAFDQQRLQLQMPAGRPPSEFAWRCSAPRWSLAG